MARADETSFVGKYDCLHSVAKALLLQDMGEVGLRCRLGLAVGTLMNLAGFAAGQIVLLDASGAILLAAMASVAWHTYITAAAPSPASSRVTLGLHPS